MGYMKTMDDDVKSVVAKFVKAQRSAKATALAASEQPGGGLEVDAAASSALLIQSLARLQRKAEESSEASRRITQNSDALKRLAYITCCSWAEAAIREAALSVLVVLPMPSKDLESDLSGFLRPRIRGAAARFLGKSSNLQARINVATLLERLEVNMFDSDSEIIVDGLVDLLGAGDRAACVAIRALSRLCRRECNRNRAIHIGVVDALAMENVFHCENSMALLEVLCESGNGRSAVSWSSSCVRLIASRMFKSDITAARLLCLVTDEFSPYRELVFKVLVLEGVPRKIKLMLQREFAMKNKSSDYSKHSQYFLTLLSRIHEHHPDVAVEERIIYRHMSI